MAHRKHPGQAYPWMPTGRKKLTHPLWRLAGTRALALPLWVQRKSELYLSEDGSLGHKTLAFWNQPGALLLVARGSQIGELSIKAWAAAGTTCPQNLPFRIPWSNTGCSLAVRARNWHLGASRQAQYSHSSVQPETLFPLCLGLFLQNKPVCFVFEWAILLERRMIYWPFAWFVNQFICFFAWWHACVLFVSLKIKEYFNCP